MLGTPPTPPNIPRSEPSSRGVPISWDCWLDDRSSDHNQQHRSTLGPHPAHPACPCRPIRRGLRPHLLIAGLRSPPLRTRISMPSRARAPRVPLPRVRRGQQRSLTSPADGYPQVSIRAGQPLDRRPIFQAGARTRPRAPKVTPPCRSWVIAPEHQVGAASPARSVTRVDAILQRLDRMHERAVRQRSKAWRSHGWMN